MISYHDFKIVFALIFCNKFCPEIQYFFISVKISSKVLYGSLFSVLLQAIPLPVQDNFSREPFKEIFQESEAFSVRI